MIGIGAGPATDGQVLVFHDLLGIREGRGARFVQALRRHPRRDGRAACAAYAEDVRTQRYPGPEHGYSIPAEELAAFRAAIGRRRRRRSTHGASAATARRTGRARSQRLHSLHCRRGPSVPGLRPPRPRVLRPLRGGRREHRPRGRSARPDARAAGPDTPELARDILVCEQEGDRITHDIIHRLNQTFVTPIDREDILALASALDDIVDFTEEVADYLGLYRIEAPMEQAQRLAHILVQATRQVAEAMPRLRGFQRHPPLHGRDQPARERRRPRRARGDRLAVRRRDRPDGRDPLEGHLRAPRGGDRRLRARRERARGHRRSRTPRRPSWAATSSSYIVVATALAFDFTNGFHDTANAIATAISTRALSPRVGGRAVGGPELRRRVHLARGRRDGRQGHRRRPTRSRRRSSSPA